MHELLFLSLCTDERETRTWRVSFWDGRERERVGSVCSGGADWWWLGQADNNWIMWYMEWRDGMWESYGLIYGCLFVCRKREKLKRAMKFVYYI